MKIRSILLLLLLSVQVAWSNAAEAQNWPSRPIRLVIPAPAGSPIDVVSRLVGAQMQASLGQPVVIDNRPGADGSLAAAAVANAAADGYTLLLGNAGIFTINPGYSNRLNYNPFTQFAPVARLATAVLVIDIHPMPGVKTLGDFVAQVRKSPEKFSYASSTGRSGIAYLSGELLKAKADMPLTWVGYSQDTQALNDVLANRISMYIDSLGTSLPHYRAGKLQILAVTGERRAPQLPDVPTIEESGFAGVSGEAWVGLFAPSGTPGGIVEKLNSAARQALSSREVGDRLIGYGFDPALSSPKELSEIIRKDYARWSQLIKALNLTRE